MDEIQDLPEHLRDALWRVESSGIRRFSASGLSVAVADGLSLGAGLLDPPAGDALLAISYSGEDAPVLAAFEAAKGPRFTLTTGGALAEAARAAGAPVIPLPGGFEDLRLASGYALVAVAAVAWLGGLADKPDVDAAADAVAARLARPDAAVSDAPLAQAAVALLEALRAKP